MHKDFALRAGGEQKWEKLREDTWETIELGKYEGLVILGSINAKEPK